MRIATALLLLVSGAAVASAATVTYEPFKSAEGWTYGNNQNSGLMELNAETGVMALSNKNWSQSYAYKTIDSISLAKPTDSLTFSFTCRGDEFGGMSISLVGTEKTITVGFISYENGGTQYAVHTPLADTATHLNVSGFPVDDIKDITTGVRFSSTFQAVTFTGGIAWDDEASQYQLSISDGQNTLSDIDLGTSFDIQKLHVSADGWNNRTYSFTDFSITADIASVPEPTTASLSLLALAGLMARRRRS